MSLFGNNATVTTTFAGRDNLSPVVRGIRRTMDQFKRDAATGFGLAGGISVFNVATQAIGKATDFMMDASKAASAQAEAMSKVNVVFGEQADEIQDWSRSAATSMGLTRTAALDAAGSLGNLFDGLGIAEDAGREMSKAIVQLAGDLGSFNNVATDEVLVALKSGLVGETEPMRRFGSALSAARVEAYGFANGLFETVRVGNQTKRVMSEAQKVQARYALILQDTKNAQGDFARTADGMANSQKTINAAFEDMKVQVGEALNEAALPFLQFMVDVVGQAPNTGTAVGRMTQHMRDLIEAQKDQADTSQQQIGLFDAIGREIYGFISPQDKLISDYTNNNREMVATLGVSRKEFALFVEAGLAMGLSLEDITKKVRQLQGEVGATAPLITDAWTGLGTEAQETGAVIYGGLVRPTRRAMRDMFATAGDAKGPWKAAMKALAEAGKDPFSDEKFAGWMRRKAREFVRNARREYRQGKGDNRAAAQALAYVMTNPILVALANTQEEIEALANAAAVILDIQGRIGGFKRNGSTGKNPNAQIGPTGGINVGNNAMGGHIAPGETSLVGENGPELITVAGGGGLNVTPNHRMGQPINVYVDGQRLFRILDARTGRAIAMGG